MNTDNSDELKTTIADMAKLIENNEIAGSQNFSMFFQKPELAFRIIEYINQLDENTIDEGPPLYSASIYALEMCVTYLQTASENNNRGATKVLDEIMNHLAMCIEKQQHSLNFWLPILNVFYDVHADLTSELREAFLNLSSHEADEIEEVDERTHLEAIRELILEMSDLSVFEIAEHFFAQSYAMPIEFFSDLIIDLYQISEGEEIALMTLLHPKAEVRDMAVATYDQIIDKITLSSISLSRLENIKHWYPTHYHAQFNHWIKIQRKKGVVFTPERSLTKAKLYATEVDGTESQGIFIHITKRKENRLCGLLLNMELGIKDAWITPFISAAEVTEYYNKALIDNVSLRSIDNYYLHQMLEHFLITTVQHGSTPPIQFLEIIELLGLRIRPNALDKSSLFEQLSIEIVPFTQDTITMSLQRSKNWLKTKSFTESWYIESPIIDKIVNHNSSFVDGVKVCRLNDAIADVFAEEMELHRDKWEFHFLWTALWFKASAKKNEKVWLDSFLIAYSIHAGTPLKDIPVMQEICRQTVINSIETMQERRTYLNKE